MFLIKLIKSGIVVYIVLKVVWLNRPYIWHTEMLSAPIEIHLCETYNSTYPKNL